MTYGKKQGRFNMYTLADRVSCVSPSATRAIAEHAQNLKKSGVDVISLSTGEPDFVSPEGAKQSAIHAIQQGQTFYTATAGINDLKQAVVEYYKNRFDLCYHMDDVLVATGAKQLLFQAFAVLLNAGDEVIITAPAWVSYVEQVKIFAGVPIVVGTNPDTLDLDIEKIKHHITSKTKAFVLNAPNNPSGKIYDTDTLKQLCALAIQYDFVIINDEVYEQIIFDPYTYKNPLCYAPECKDHVLNINAVSKTYAMTGWRIGYALGPQTIIKAMTKLQGHITSGTSSISQWAAVGAITDCQDDVKRMVQSYGKRKQLIENRIAKMPYITHIKPQGTFYVFVNVQDTIGKKINHKIITDDTVFCAVLLENVHLAVVPGQAFLQPGFIRISFATSETIIDQAMDRLHAFLNALEN